MTVAVIGVAVPFVLGGGVALGFGETGNTALFIGAALTATSVGITARVFGDLRALATTEARVVLGAAVADDVLGLLILTVVVKIVTGDDVDALSIFGTIGGAIGFLVIATAAGIVTVPIVFRAIDGWSRSSATLVVVALGFVLAFSWTASWANLAPIIGAFVAGLAIGRSDHHARVEREFGAVGQRADPGVLRADRPRRRPRGDGQASGARPGRGAARSSRCSASWRRPAAPAVCVSIGCSSASG